MIENRLNELLEVDNDKYGNYIVITDDKDLNIKNIYFVNNFPIKLQYLIEKINIQLLKQKNNSQSEIIIKKYKKLNGKKSIRNLLNKAGTSRNKKIIMKKKILKK